MSQEYITSIIFKYGDMDNVRNDSKVVFEIISRQGINFLIDLIAESCGETANKFKFNTIERQNLIDSYLGDFNQAMGERL